jgi:acetyl-CoA carboxylase biotin carboxylase subunit
LSENAGFAEVCDACNITFIGPSPKSISQMGHKSTAREMAVAAGTPVIPGSEGTLDTLEIAQEVALGIGYPVMLKAASGGGGRGMRMLRDEEDLVRNFDMVRSEADAAFKDPSVYMEKLVLNPKHVEIQIMADRFGNVVHLGERECSVQRRHQKLIEEAPSPAISPETRAAMAASAINLAEKIGYHSVGTMEYLYDQETKEFYFIEMNTRIQVEHTITETLTGFDLVKEQIRIAAGEKLRHTQKDIVMSGHSIECRINAEDPATFIPCAGLITELNMPGGPGVRVDTAIYPQYRVSPYYDSLLAKVIVRGIDRTEAIIKMRRALQEFHVGGIKTTIPTCLKILKNDLFISGNYHTGSIDELLADQEQ